MMISQELELPIAQNFIRLKPIGFITQSETIDIAVLDETQAELYSELIKKQFLENWKKRRESFGK